MTVWTKEVVVKLTEVVEHWIYCEDTANTTSYRLGLGEKVKSPREHQIFALSFWKVELSLTEISAWEAGLVTNIKNSF